MFKRLILTVLSFGLALTTTTLLAQARPDTRRMSCDQATDLVEDSGAIVMTTGRHTYERIVRNRNYCDHDENIRQVYAPTRDDRRCHIGYKCVPEYIIHNFD